MTPFELRARRLALGLTQPKLAELLGVSRSTIIRWETGVSWPDAGKMLELALERIEDVSSEDLQDFRDMLERGLALSHEDARNLLRMAADPLVKGATVALMLRSGRAVRLTIRSPLKTAPERTESAEKGRKKR